MIDKFCYKNLSGATYACNFSGRYYYWDNDNIQRTKLLTDNEFTLFPNSITFLEIEQFFRIPIYIVLRFNLQVSHAYKGLLLGTGPIVDPNFVGRLYIPLHNLTSNEYVIKKNAPLINVEFTKLSRNSDWQIEEWSNQEKIKQKLIFDDVKYKITEIKPNRLFAEYTEKALKDDEYFYKKDRDSIYINSSIPETKETLNSVNKRINEYKEEIEKNKKDLEDREKIFKEEIDEEKIKIEKLINEVKNKERNTQIVFIITIIGLIISILVLFITSGMYFDERKEIPKFEQQIKEQQEDFDKYKTDSQKAINTLKNRIRVLEVLENDKAKKETP
jgi:uncharacterized membrane-anchored protein YhcB (DUF1043 family)